MDKRERRRSISAVRRSSPDDGVAGIMHLIKEQFGFENAVYHASNLRNLTDQSPYLKLTYNDAWVSRYVSENYFLIDPVIKEAEASSSSFNWDEIDWSSPQSDEFRKTSVEFEVGRSGMSIPIKGRFGETAIFSVTTDMAEAEWRKYLHEAQRELEILASVVHERVFELEDVDSLESDRALTRREIDVLQYIATGLTGEQAAQKLKITERTVRSHVETARGKLGATNRVHVIARAISRGLIDPID